jgi:type IV pilus assembly protein PilO
MNERSRITWQERLRSPLTWHIVGFAALVVVVAVLAVRFALDWSATSTSSNNALQQKQVQYKILERQTAPLRGLDKRVAASHAQIDAFFTQRVPAHYSSIAVALGDVQQKSGARLTRVQYAQGTPGADLTEISIDAGLSGDYPQIMRFVNGLERDQTFFVVRAMALTGQQGGMVNLRLRVSTWLRPAEVPSGIPAAGAAPPAPSTPQAKEGQ